MSMEMAERENLAMLVQSLIERIQSLEWAVERLQPEASPEVEASRNRDYDAKSKALERRLSRLTEPRTRAEILEKIAALERDLEAYKQIRCGTPALRTRQEIENLQEKLAAMNSSPGD